MKRLSFAFVLGAAIAAAGLTYAQSQMNHDAMDHTAHGETSDDPVIAGYMAANDRMHRDMAIDFTGDADVDFVRGMIPHHQGAIDMARVVLEHGADPEILRFAEAVIVAQEAEIAMMREWLAARGLK